MGMEVGVGGGSGRWEVELGVEVDVEVGVGVGVPRGRCGGLRAAPSPVFLQRSAEGPKWLGVTACATSRLPEGRSGGVACSIFAQA